MRRALYFLFSLAIYATVASNSHGVEQCPAVDCDCSSIPNGQWAEVCLQHQALMKSECVANANTPKDYCLIHGPAAKPLPLAIEFSELVLDDVDAEVLKGDVKNRFDVIDTAVQIGAALLARHDYGAAWKVLKSAEAKIEALFEQQRKVEAVMVASGKDKKMRESWRGFSKEALKVARQLDEMGKSLIADIGLSKDKKKKKMLAVLSQRMLRIAGRKYEHSAYALARGGRHKQAAKIWEAAADASVRIASVRIALSGSGNSAKYAEYQAAARLQRASYHWLLSEDEDASNKSLKESQKYVGRRDQKSLAKLLENTQQDAEIKAISRSQ